MAELIFKKMIDDQELSNLFYVDSCATSDEEIGNNIYPSAKDTLIKNGIPVYDHIARKIDQSDYDKFDYIIGMEESNIYRIKNLIGDPDIKVYKLLDFNGTSNDIEDPWYTGNFDKVYSQIHMGCEALLSYLTKNF